MAVILCRSVSNETNYLKPKRVMKNLMDPRGEYMNHKPTSNRDGFLCPENAFNETMRRAANKVPVINSGLLSTSKKWVGVTKPYRSLEDRPGRTIGSTLSGGCLQKDPWDFPQAHNPKTTRLPISWIQVSLTAERILELLNKHLEGTLPFKLRQLVTTFVAAGPCTIPRSKKNNTTKDLAVTRLRLTLPRPIVPDFTKNLMPPAAPLVALRAPLVALRCAKKAPPPTVEY